MPKEQDVLLLPDLLLFALEPLQLQFSIFRHYEK